MRTNEKLLQWRLAANLSQREAAALAKMSQPAWQSYEAGTKMPRIDAAGRIQTLTKDHVKVSDWTVSDEDRAVRKARAATRRIHRTKPPATSSAARRTGTDG